MFRVFTNTLEVSVQSLSAAGTDDYFAASGVAPLQSHLQLAVDRERPLVWELELDLPANSLTRVR